MALKKLPGGAVIRSALYMLTAVSPRQAICRAEGFGKPTARATGKDKGCGLFECDAMTGGDEKRFHPGTRPEDRPNSPAPQT